MLEALLTPAALVGLLTLTILEVVLGVDNVIFLAIVTEPLPAESRPMARKLGLSLALLGRIGMVLGISWLLGLQKGLFTAAGHRFSASDLILIAGGLFLVYKATVEIFNTTELREEQLEMRRAAVSMSGVVAQVVVVDMIFAVDSVLTAVGLTKQVVLIIIAMTIAILVMMFYSGPLSDFIHRHPSVKLLALAFLVVIGIMLILDGFGSHVDRSYVYAAILFALGVEALNFRRRANLERGTG
jgi:predicted tellurium resistance membrane protein TerC